MLQSVSFSGSKTEDFPAEMKLSLVISLFRFVHNGTKLLMLESGVGGEIVEFSPDSQVRVIRLKLPDKQVADSILSVKIDGWFVPIPKEQILSQTCTKLIQKLDQHYVKYVLLAYPQQALLAQAKTDITDFAGLTRSFTLSWQNTSVNS